MECYGTQDVCSQAQADRIEEMLKELIAGKHELETAIADVMAKGPAGLLTMMNKR